MELKCHNKQSGSYKDRSNRTFMELKLTLQGVGTKEELVLIVPLWN